MSTDNMVTHRYLQNNDAPKASSVEELLTAVREAVRGRRYLSPDVAQTYASAMLDGPDRVLERLSPREFEIMRLLVDGHSLDDIAARLNLSYKTVANHQSVIRQKTGAQSTLELARIAERHGVVPARNSDN